VGVAFVETLEFYATQGDLLTGKPMQHIEGALLTRSWVSILFAKMHCQT